jgi:hypothetical protein
MTCSHERCSRYPVLLVTYHGQQYALCDYCLAVFLLELCAHERP